MNNKHEFVDFIFSDILQYTLHINMSICILFTLCCFYYIVILCALILNIYIYISSNKTLISYSGIQF